MYHYNIPLRHDKYIVQRYIMTVMEKVRENPWKIILGSSGSIIALVGALFTLDARYAHAADVERNKKETQQIIRETSTVLRKQMVEDKLFELDVKEAQANGRLSPIDSALKERYKRQLKELREQTK